MRGREYLSDIDCLLHKRLCTDKYMSKGLVWFMLFIMAPGPSKVILCHV